MNVSSILSYAVLRNHQNALKWHNWANTACLKKSIATRDVIINYYTVILKYFVVKIFSDSHACIRKLNA